MKKRCIWSLTPRVQLSVSIMCYSTISSRLSTATSETVKCCWSRLYKCPTFTVKVGHLYTSVVRLKTSSTLQVIVTFQPYVAISLQCPAIVMICCLSSTSELCRVLVTIFRNNIARVSVWETRLVDELDVFFCVDVETWIFIIVRFWIHQNNNNTNT